MLFPLLFCVACATQPVSESRLEVVAELSQPPGNIAVTPNGRLIISQHPLYRPQTRVIELLPDGSVRPFPNEKWASQREKAGIGLDGVLGIQADQDGIVWMLDNGRQSSRLVAWDTLKNELHKIIEVGAPGRARGSFFNDIAVDPVHHSIFISDASAKNAAIVVVDTDSERSRRVLERHASVMAEPIAMVIGENTYSVDKDGRPVARIERYGYRPICDGITIDGAGNVYITDLTNYAVGVVGASGDYRILHRDEDRLSWPDGMSFGPDGYVYVVANQLHLSPLFNRGKDLSKPPFYVLRFQALAPGATGR
jgi:sugar lactone lactonase YvrE